MTKAELQAENAALRAQLTELLARVGTLTEGMAKANDRIAELLATVQRKKAKPPASTPPGPPPVLDDAGRSRFDDRPQPPAPVGDLVDHPRQKQRPTGRKALPSHLPVVASTTPPLRCAARADARRSTGSTRSSRRSSTCPRTNVHA